MDPPTPEDTDASRPRRSAWPLARDPQRCYQIVMQAMREMLSSPDCDSMLKSVVATLVPGFSDWCFVNILTANGGTRHLCEARHVSPQADAALNAIRCQYPPNQHARAVLTGVIRSGKSELMHAPEFQEEFEKVSNDPESLRLWHTVGIVSYLGIPLRVRGEIIGAIGFVSLTPGRFYSQDDNAFAEDLAHLLTLALERSALKTEATASKRLKDEFLASLSHELRTPMTAILGWAQLLLDDAEAHGIDRDTTVYLALSTIVRNATHETRLINDMLDMSVTALGKMRLEVHPVDLCAVLRNTSATLSPAASAKGLKLNLESLPATAVVNGDPTRLHQLVYHLVDNAIKFSSANGSIELNLKRDGAYFFISVRDHGIGISAEFLPYVFERFRQAQGSHNRAHGGLGLGLGLARDLADLHGGTVQAESAGIGLGATFTVRLPAIHQ